MRACVQTAVACTPAGVFRCPLVVTMCPVPAAVLDAAVEVTYLNLAHGAPVHIGDPGIHKWPHTHIAHRVKAITHEYVKKSWHAGCECVYIVCICTVALLGIQDLSRPDYGEQAELQPSDVTVFWACGVTAIEAIHSSSEQYD